MKKREIVKENKYFNSIINEGKNFANRYFIIYYKEKEQKYPHFGIAVGKKIGNAVERNRIKRRLRSIITTNKNLFPYYNDYIIIAKKFCKEEKYDKLEISMQNLIRKGDSSNA